MLNLQLFKKSSFMKRLMLVFITLFLGHIYAQDKAVVMTINGKPVYSDEFEKMYTKNLDLVQDPAQKDIDNYRDLFIDYKLELEDAYQKKYDTAPKLKKELASYRRDLAKKYLSDNDIIDKLIKEAYERMKNDVHVAHILIQVSPEAAPADTLKAYNKIMSIYEKAQKGADFGELAQKFSQDPSAKTNKGDLDYINVFHTVYPFETAVYNTPVGQVSKPVRTRFGYHLIKVLDKRPARGEVEVAHILALNRKSKKDKNEQDAKTRIFQIYDKLKNNQDTFENLARKFSDDKNSAKSGGRLRKFGIRQMIPEFENTAFSLKNEGDFSKPFQTKYGWHIIKLLKKYPVPEFKQIKTYLRQKVLRDERSKMGKEKLLKKIAKEFPITMNGSLEDVYQHITKDFFVNKWKIPNDASVNKALFTINNDKVYTYKDFYGYLYSRQSRNPATYDQKKHIINTFFERFKKDKLFEYYNNHLEEIYPDFAQTMSEYKHGLMLFNVKSDMVWNKSIKDTLGLQQFFEQRRINYKLPKRFDVLMVQANDKRTAKKIAKDLKKGKSKTDISKKYQSDKIIVKEREFTEKELLSKYKGFPYKPSLIKDGNQYIVLYIVKTKPPADPDLKEVKGKVTGDYQNYLEQQWLNNLKEKYPVKINKKNWQQIRAKYKK